MDMKKAFSIVMFLAIAATALFGLYNPPTGRKPVGITLQLQQAVGKKEGWEITGEYWANSNWHKTACVVTNTNNGTVFCPIAEKYAGTTLSQVRVLINDLYYYFYDVNVPVKADEVIYF
jgi:hypothetical protein